MEPSAMLRAHNHDKTTTTVQDREKLGDSDVDARDALALARTGKKQVLKRRFNLGSMIGFTSGLMSTWEGMLVTFLLGYQNGGPAGLIYGFIFIWLGNLSFSIVLGELSSMVPTAGGQYHWVSLLAPDPVGRFLSYVTGWVTVAGWVAAAITTGYFGASLIQALIIVNRPDYVPQSWHMLLMYWAILIIYLLINTHMSKALPLIEVMVLIMHITGFFAILIPLVYLAPQRSTAGVFTTFQNLGGWSSQGLSFLIGLNGSAVAFIGTDGPIHMSEEVQNAQKNVPRAMIWGIIINGTLALALLIAVLCCIPSVDAAITNAPNGYIFIVIFVDEVGLKGATAMTVIPIVMVFCCGVGALAAASRMMWSFARDRGLPGHRYLSRVSETAVIPMYSAITVFVLAALIAIISIGSTTAFNDFVSLVLGSFYTSYLLACAILLYRRIKGDIGEPETDNLPSIPPALPTPTSTSDRKYHARWGPWRLKGAIGIANNVLACAYLSLVAFFSYWPAVLPITPVNMNYSSLVLGAAMLGSAVYYYWARKTYVGPIVEVAVGVPRESGDVEGTGNEGANGRSVLGRDLAGSKVDC